MNKLKIKTLIVLMLTALTTSWLVSAEQPAKDFALKLENMPAQLSDLKGQVVYVDFWASWCKPCRKSFPWMNAIQQKYAKQGLQIITVNLDSEQNLADEFLQNTPTTLPVVFDPEGKIASAYQLVGMPSSYLIDKAGNIRFTHTGFFTKKETKYEQEIVSLIQEKE
ncbi:TlpA disulfide reductase family protein [Paraglaciecola sp. L3A3]|uniref:TlpA disulfide reductase family protein n=1 Tax=Paraglaciecola sp. L3A3 TaxID=2686358 RepID=UPI00351A02C2